MTIQGSIFCQPFFLQNLSATFCEKSPEASYSFSMNQWNLELDYMTFCATDLQIDFNSAVNRLQFIFQIKSNEILLKTEKRARTSFDVRWLKPNWNSLNCLSQSIHVSDLCFSLVSRQQNGQFFFFRWFRLDTLKCIACFTFTLLKNPFCRRCERIYFVQSLSRWIDENSEHWGPHIRIWWRWRIRNLMLFEIKIQRNDLIWCLLYSIFFSFFHCERRICEH